MRSQLNSITFGHTWQHTIVPGSEGRIGFFTVFVAEVSAQAQHTSREHLIVHLSWVSHELFNCVDILHHSFLVFYGHFDQFLRCANFLIQVECLDQVDVLFKVVLGTVN